MNKNLTRRKKGRVEQAQDLLLIKQNLKVRLKFWGFEYFYIGKKGLKMVYLIYILIVNTSAFERIWYNVCNWF